MRKKVLSAQLALSVRKRVIEVGVILPALYCPALQSLKSLRHWEGKGRKREPTKLSVRNHKPLLYNANKQTVRQAGINNPQLYSTTAISPHLLRAHVWPKNTAVHWSGHATTTISDSSPSISRTTIAQTISPSFSLQIERQWTYLLPKLQSIN